MATGIYWFVAVFGYIVQTKCLSILQTRDGLEDNDDEKTHQGLMVLLTFIYFSSWVLLKPISVFFHGEGGDVKSYLAVPLGSTTEVELQSFSEEHENTAATAAPVGAAVSPGGRKFTVKYVAKLLTLSVLLLIPMLSYTMAISMSPAFDVSLIQNTSIFEITSLLYGVCGLTKRRNLLRNFVVMMAALFGILIVSYTKATCDLLAGKLSINESTGELNDPFLFDRLKSALLCGLGALTIGPFAVLWNKWFNNSKNITLTEQCSHLSKIGFTCMICLLPLFPSLKDAISFVYKDQAFWGIAISSTLLGSLPAVLSLLQINRRTNAEYATTINLGNIIFMGISDWIFEPKQTTIIRWEVIGYVILSLCCIILSMVYYNKKN